MKPQTSSSARSSQQDSSLALKIAERLREERVRVEPHQGRFAERIGVTQQKQSFLESANRELRADYLAAAAALGVDVHYVLTGGRLTGDLLDTETSEVLNIFLALPMHMRQMAKSVLRTMADEAGIISRTDRAIPPPATVHEKKDLIRQRIGHE